MQTICRGVRVYRRRYVCEDVRHSEYLMVRDVCATVQKVCDNWTPSAPDTPTVQMGCPVQMVSNCAGEDDANTFGKENIAVHER